MLSDSFILQQQGGAPMKKEAEGLLSLAQEVDVRLIIDESGEKPAVRLRVEGIIPLPQMSSQILRGFSKSELLRFLLQRRNLN